MVPAKVFENASQFTIQGSEFNAVAGDQITVNHNTNYVGDGPPTQVISGRRSLNQFRVIPDGDVFVLSTRSSVIKDSQDKVRVVRSISTVQVVGLGESRNFTAVTYEGPQSKEAFEDDLVQHSQSRHRNFTQLFGVVHGVSVPALIFHSELIPLQYFAKLCSSSPLALAYLNHRFSLDVEEAERVTKSMYANDQAWFISGKQCWIQPTSGLICAGPLAPSSNDPIIQKSYPPWNQRDQFRTVPQLGFQLYTSDHDIIKHIEEHFDSVVSFVALLLGDKDVVDASGHLFTFGSVMTISNDFDYLAKPEQIIAQIPSTLKMPYFVEGWKNRCGKAPELHSSGWGRVSHVSSEEPYFFDNEIKSPHLSTNAIQTAWLAQAECILENIEQRYVLFSSTINMILSSQTIGPRIAPVFWDRNIYLFIAPVNVTEIESIPYFSFNNVQPYFWSLDENGAQPISRTTQDLLGLPSFQASITGVKWWPTIEHVAVSQYLKLKGFSSGVKYSRKHGYPLFKSPENTVADDGFEIIEAVLDDTGDDWELIPENKAYDSSGENSEQN
ncbi:hypothetical protein BDP27DRAFT_1433058 [Rhodocollybia butyracea]|uniref:Uncharacterized protein n=1 Tax=Rhodocollybia butyracea TaxID=206335 RepID=A0A9P5P847_9AGAR|nr:hypothetical protein BDP27DRAFT_1433058 [Rhodocollybia butyracea]